MLRQYYCHDSIMQLINMEATCAFKLSGRWKKMKGTAAVAFALHIEPFSGTVLVQSATMYACNHYWSSLRRSIKKCMHIYFCRTICKKQCLKHHCRSNSMCNFSLSNVLHNNKKALIKTGTLTTLVMGKSNSKPRFFPIQKCIFF